MTESENGVRLMLGDCLERLRELPDCSVDSVVTDPPYGLSFMGKKWDYDVPGVEVWAECLRVLKPGGHLLAFAGTRTQHRMAVRIEDAGFEIRDMIAWVYGSGFPKSHNLKDEWQGWGTALKPALEPITVARKPLGEKTVAANVLEHRTGGINVDGCRVGTEIITQRLATVEGGKAIGAKAVGVKQKATGETTTTIGRWPANLIHDGSNEVVGLFPVTTSGGGDKHGRKASLFCISTDWKAFKGTSSGGDTGSAARFFYCAKASKKDRDEGCDHLPEHQEGLQLPRGKCPDCGTWKNSGELKCKCGGEWQMTLNPPPKARNNHPTVKPTALMRYLCRLVTPPEGIVLDPFMGSGSTGKAAMLEDFQFVGIERDAEYFEIATSRIAVALPMQFQMVT
jgi:site-specific DNA-methyltransferase (adenine-specific)